jgi:hypothetical protein
MPSPPLFESCHAESTEYLLGRKRAGGIGVNSAGISDQPRFRQDGRRGLPFSHSLVSMSFISVSGETLPPGWVQQNSLESIE